MSLPQVCGYHVEGIIGQGGMGTVYRGIHTALERPVAIKVLHENLAQDQDICRRFRDEARLMARLQHPNLVQLYDFRDDTEHLVLIMEFVAGSSLDRMIGREVGPIPFERALPLFMQMLDGVETAHRHGVLHRDIKPANILVTEDHRAKITDFGIAKIAGKKGLTRTGTRVGTLYYMAPEQVRGEEADARSDLYALGVTLYEMLSGHMPFNMGTTDYMIMSAILKEQLPDPRTYYPHIPDWLVEALFRAVDKDPHQRFSSCSEFSEYLGNMWDGVSGTALPVPLPVATSHQETSPLGRPSFCTRCGSTFDPEDEFCTRCGSVR